MKINEGEVPQYYVENSHPAIVSSEMFDLVQQELERRKAQKRQTNGTSIFSGKLICGCCGNAYGSKVWHSNDKYRRIIWQCNGKFRNEKKCTTPHLTEDEIRAAFVKAMNRLIVNKDTIITDCRMLMKEFTDCKALEQEMAQAQSEMDVLSDLLRKMIEENAHTIQDQEEYAQRYAALEERYNALNKKYESLEAEKRHRKFLKDNFMRFISTVAHTDAISEFSPDAWTALVENVTINSKENIQFNFRNGMHMKINATENA